MTEGRRTRQRLLAVAAVVLLLTAGLNALGYSEIAQRLSASGMEVAWSAGLKGVWLSFSLHLAIIGVLVAIGSIRPGLVSNVVIRVCALIPTVDSGILFAFVGPVPAVFLSVAAVLIWLAGTVFQQEPEMGSNE